MAPLEAIRVTRQIADALTAAHRAGVVHRDVKPSNILLDTHGTQAIAKLLDFGIARLIDAGAGATGLVGTPGYMAPEQADASRTVDGRADLYALGLTLFEMLTGRPPFTAESALKLMLHQVSAPLPDLRATALGVPEPLVRLVEQMAEKDPDARLARGEAVIAALDEIVRSITDPSSAPSSDAQAVTTRRGGGRVVWLAIAGGALALVLGGSVIARRARVVPPVIAPTIIAPVVVAPAPAPAAIPSGKLRVAFLDFVNLADDPRLRQLAQGIREDAQHTIAERAGERVTLVERTAIDGFLHEIDLQKDPEHWNAASFAKLGGMLGADVIVAGSFQPAGDAVRVSFRVVRVGTAVVEAARNVDGASRPPQKLFELQDRVGAALTAELIKLVDKR
jgi:TolB-like protein